MQELEFNCGSIQKIRRYVLQSCKENDVSNFIRKQQKNYAGHLVRRHIERCEKQLMFKDNKYHRTGRVPPSGTSAEV